MQGAESAEVSVLRIFFWGGAKKMDDGAAVGNIVLLLL